MNLVSFRILRRICFVFFHCKQIYISSFLPLEESSQSDTDRYYLKLYLPLFNGNFPSPSPQMQVGDWIYYENMGDYTLCAASVFNGFTRPRIDYVVEEFHVPTLSQIYQPVIEFQDAPQESELQ